MAKKKVVGPKLVEPLPVIPPPVNPAQPDTIPETIVVIPPEVVPTYPVPGLNPTDAHVLRMAVAELARRKFEALRLYKPLECAIPFHESQAKVRLNIGANRSGKTNSAAVEFARAVTGQDVQGKYPKEDGVAFVFGLTEHHLGSVIYQKLFRAGSFDMIRDLETGDWRAFDPVLDADRKAERKPAPPLVPPRFIKKVSWSDKGIRAPKLIELTNGWEIYFFSSLGELPQGQKINLWWIDEEMKRKNLMEELFARCLDLSGVGFWSATPQAATVQLYDLHDRAARGDADVMEFKFKLIDNPYISQLEKDAFYNSLDEEARRVRYFGEFALSRLTVYPEFSKTIHAWDLQKYPVKPNWSRWLAVDPGRQRCAVLFAGLPPPEEVRFKAIVAYDELYIENCTAAEFGRQVGLKSGGIVYEGGVIDMHEAGRHEIAGGRTISSQYEEALRNNGVEFRGGAPAFIWGSDDVMGGIEKVREWLRVQPGGHPYFHVVIERMRWFLWEIERYRNKVDPETQLPTDKPHQKQNHLQDAFRYLAMLDPKHRRPPVPVSKRPSALRSMEVKRKKARTRGEDDGGGMIIRLSNWSRGKQ